MIISQAGPTSPFTKRGGWSLKFARALIPFRLRARQSYPPLAEYTHKRERKREIDREREMLDTNGLELGLNGVLSGHDLLKIGPSTRIVSPADTFSKMNKLIVVDILKNMSRFCNC